MLGAELPPDHHTPESVIDFVQDYRPKLAEHSRFELFRIHRDGTYGTLTWF
jgi:hypothetical protein